MVYALFSPVQRYAKSWSGATAPEFFHLIFQK